MLRDLYVFSQKTCLSTEKNHLTAKFRNPSITFAAIIICTYLRFRLINRRMNMINVRRLTVIAFLGAGLLPGISAQESSL